MSKPSGCNTPVAPPAGKHRATHRARAGLQRQALLRLHPIHMGRIVLHLPAEGCNLPGIGDPVESDRTDIRGKPYKTTIPDKKPPRPLDKVNRQFRVPAPNMLWGEPLPDPI